MIPSLILLFESRIAPPVILILVTLLLASAAIAARLLRRQSAATRHFAWALALGGTLALPFLAPVAPRWALPIPLQISSDRVEVRSAPSTSVSDDAESHRRTSSTPAVVERSASRISIAPSQWLLVLWIAGGAMVLARVVIGHLVVVRVTRQAHPLGGQVWTSLLAEARQRTHSSTAVRLCRSESVGAPITWGWTTPVVVFPAAVETWPAGRRRAALEHELAHVERRDYVTQLVAALACALYWFHPFVWLAARRLRAESEYACDDRVLSAGTSASDYATHLLEVARGARPRRFTETVAVCMANTSHLETRLRALLDEARTRNPWPKWAGLFAVLALGIILVPVAGLRPAFRVARAATQPESNRVAQVVDPAASFDRTVDVSPGQELRLELKTGGDVLIRAWEENRVQVHVELDGPDWRETQVDVEAEPGGVRITSRQKRHKQSQSTSHRFEIQVPSRFDVELQSSGGGLEIVGVEGNLHGKTGGGEIVLERMKGTVQFSTGGGDIRVTDVEASGKVSTGGGMVRLSRVRGGLLATSGSGPVIHSESTEDDSPGDLTEVYADDDNIRDERTGEAGVLHIVKAGGDVTLQDAPHGADIQTGGGDIRVRSGKGLIEATTGGGDIDIGPIAGSVVATTGSGEVHVALVDAKGEEQKVKISAGTGPITVLLPAGFEGRFDLETAYTENYEGTTHIESDWKLERDETATWDGRHGTPRRYVRAHGTVGDGRNRVRVRTVNGDIIIKRSGGSR